MDNFITNPPRCYEDTIARWRKHALHVITNAGAYRPSLVQLAWAFLRQHK
jgi:hypothetical protein